VDAVAGTYAVEADDLVKHYGEVVALDGISLAIEAGSLFALLGPNGAGKSTAVRILTTLAVPTRGAVRVAGIDALRRPAAVRRAIGVVGQRHGSGPQATGRENLELQGALYGLRGAPLRARVDEMLQRLGIAEAADRVVRTYSGGMQRRLDVAMGSCTSRACCSSTSPRPGSTRRRGATSGSTSGRWPPSAR
jgi:ABC-2 type transport system ATP-binding protein